MVEHSTQEKEIVDIIIDTVGTNDERVIEKLEQKVISSDNIRLMFLFSYYFRIANYLSLAI